MCDENYKTGGLMQTAVRAFCRARIPILTVALTYAVSVAVGMIMVHAGNSFALNTRDQIVAGAQSGPILTALNLNNRLLAGLLDYVGNLFGAFSTSIAGLGVVFIYPIVAYRGWIGGIVSVDGAHLSRLADAREAAYYLITLVLQLIPYSISGGAGVNMGLAYFKPKSCYQGNKWLGIPAEAIRDVLRLYLVAAPLFLLASLWEFFAR
ncbi:MAG: hypothetical protein ABSC61_01940 [Anaerolineales bacterium]